MKLPTALPGLIALVATQLGSISLAPGQDVNVRFAKLLTRRESLLAELEKKPAVEEALMRFAGGADRDDLWLTARRTQGVWHTAFGEVPGWHQSSMKDWRSYYHGNLTGGCWRPPLRFAADTAALKLDAGRLSGALAMTYRLDMPHDDRLPPGQPHQWWDRFIPGGNTVPRRVSYAIEADVHADRAMLDLILEGGVYWDPAFAPLVKAADPAVVRRPIHVRLQVPATPFTPVWVKTHSWIHGFHEADVAALRYDNGHLTGSMVVRLHQDGWMPWGGGKRTQNEPITVYFEIDARLDRNELAGRYKASFGGAIKGKIMYPKGDDSGDVVLPETRYEGAISGRGGKLVVGHYRAEGDLGQSAGAIDGLLLDAARPVRESFRLPDGQLTAERISAVLHQVRAMHLALQHAPLGYGEALRQTSWPAPTDASADECLRLALQQVNAMPAPDAKLSIVKLETVGDSPSFGTRAAAVAEDNVNLVPSDTAGWLFLPKWQVMGPFDQRPGLEHNTSPVPDIVVAPGATCRQTTDRLGAPFDGPGRRWQAMACADARLGAPWERTGPFARYVGQVWYGAATLRSADARTVWLSLEANDFAKLWVNDHLVWTATESIWRYRPMGRAFVPVALAAGDNRLLARIHSDRNLSWLRLALTTSEPATPATPPAPSPVNADFVFADASPPLAWDIAKGTNVAWRDAELGGSTRPVALGDALYVSVGTGTLVCVETATGKTRWSSQLPAAQAAQTGKGQPPAASAPVTDGTLVAMLNGWGTLGGYDAGGKLLWSQETGLPGGRLWVCGKRFVVEGQFQRGAKGGAAAQARIVAFDSASGMEAWRRDVPGQLQRAGMSLNVGNTSFPLSGTGALLDPQSGQPLALDGEMQITEKEGQVVRSVMDGPHRAHASSGTLYLTSQARHVALRLWERDGKLGFAHAWESNYGNSGFSNVFSAGMANDKFLFTWHSSLAHTPHSPDPRAEVNVQDVPDGRWLARNKPIMDDLYCYGPLSVTTPVIAGQYVFLLAGRSDNKRNQIAIVTADERIELVARQDVEPGTTQPPVFAGGRMILRSPTSLMCIAATTPQGRQYEKLQLARTLLRVIGRHRQYPAPVQVKPMERMGLLGDVPVSELTSDRPTDRWLGAGPFAPEALADGVALAALRAVPGTVVAGKAFAPVARTFAYNEPPAYLRTSELQGTGDTTPRFATRVDPKCVSNNRESGLLYTVLDVTHDRIVVPALDRPGVTQWLGGKLVEADVPLRLAPGLYPYLVRVGPEFYAAKQSEVLPPVGVVKAMEQGALTDIGWPKQWQVLGPLEGSDSRLRPDQLKAVPRSLTIDGNACRLFPLEADGPAVDLGFMARAELGVEPDRSLHFVRPGRSLLAYAFAHVDVPADGYLYITASCDAAMAWFVDGVSVYDRMRLGNAAPANDLDAHPFAVRVTRGRHVLAVMTGPSSSGWSFRSLGGFSQKRADEMPGLRVESRQPTPMPDFRLHACFQEAAHTPTMERMWLDRVRAHADRLRGIAADLPGTGEAQAAAAMLAQAAK
jgi:outer membrane protein assembly factor BamB